MWRYEYMSNWRIHVTLASPATGGKCLLKVFPRSILVIKVWWCCPHFPRLQFSRSGYMCICQSHVTIWWYRHKHLSKKTFWMLLWQMHLLSKFVCSSPSRSGGMSISQSHMSIWGGSASGLLSEFFFYYPKLVIITNSEVEMYVFAKVAWLHGDDIINIWRGASPELLSKRWPCCPSLVTLAHPEIDIFVFAKSTRLYDDELNITWGGLFRRLLSTGCIGYPSLITVDPSEKEISYILIYKTFHYVLHYSVAFCHLTFCRINQTKCSVWSLQHSTVTEMAEPKFSSRRHLLIICVV